MFLLDTIIILFYICTSSFFSTIFRSFQCSNCEIKHFGNQCYLVYIFMNCVVRQIGACAIYS